MPLSLVECLPPLIIQVGTHEVLLDDAIRFARQAATAISARSDCAMNL
jgi:acetyl esterase/lipase